MGEVRDAGREPRSDAVCVAYGLISKGNGEVILSKETHMSLSTGGASWARLFGCSRCWHRPLQPNHDGGVEDLE